MTKVSVLGMGYVGSVTAYMLARMGNEMYCYDTDRQKLEFVASGKSPINEQGVDFSNLPILACTTPGEAVQNSSVVFICVGTPGKAGGRFDSSYLESVCESIADHLLPEHIVVIRSTILPGTIEKIIKPILRTDRIIHWPEFMREGSAVEDFFEYRVLGCPYPELAEEFALKAVPNRTFRIMDYKESEMLKYVCNAWHALKITFANEIGVICNKHDINVEVVMSAFKSDTRLNISSAYLRPGFAFGGSCLEKDLTALQRFTGCNSPVLQNIVHSNEVHIYRTGREIAKLGPKKVAILGIGFKENVSDTRSSPYVELGKELIRQGIDVLLEELSDDVDLIIIGRSYTGPIPKDKKVIHLK